MRSVCLCSSSPDHQTAACECAEGHAVCVSVSIIYMHPTALTKLRLGEHHTHTHTHTRWALAVINTLYSWAPWALLMHTACYSLARDLLLLTLMWALSRAWALARTMCCVCTPRRQTEAHLNNDGLLWVPVDAPLCGDWEMHVTMTWNCASFNANESAYWTKHGSSLRS